MKKLITLFSLTITFLIISCGGNEKPAQELESTNVETSEMFEDAPAYDAKRGEGKWTAELLALSDKLDNKIATDGENVSNVKCLSCHKITDEKLVGPGWKDVTVRRTPEWIMNFITNPDPMIDKDPEAKAMLELCLVRMPNQSLTDEESRNILEYMRKIDGLK